MWPNMQVLSSITYFLLDDMNNNNGNMLGFLRVFLVEQVKFFNMIQWKIQIGKTLIPELSST